ncbi:MAG: AzlD domain-containing protein [Schaedlerella sp.]|nr:AzlD domain-containing protein [Schaedlerella sp.]
MSTEKLLIYILIMALVTYVPRVLPVTIFRKPIKSQFIKDFLEYMPYAVLGALTFPEIFYSTGDFTSALIGTLVALLLAYFNKGLVVVAIAAICAVFAVKIFLGI